MEIANDLSAMAGNPSLDSVIADRLNEQIGPLQAAVIDYQFMIAPLYASFNNIFAGMIEAVLQLEYSDFPHTATISLAAIAYGYLRKYAEPLERIPALSFVKVSLEWMEKYLSVTKSMLSS